MPAVIDSQSMAEVLLVGSDAPLLEGLAQTLAAVGHRSHIAYSLMEAAELAVANPPLIVVTERALTLDEAAVLRIPLAPGGTILLYHSEPEKGVALSPSLLRATIADVSLPLERHRLIAIVQRVAERARITGRGPRQTPPEQPRYG